MNNFMHNLLGIFNFTKSYRLILGLFVFSINFTPLQSQGLVVEVGDTPQLGSGGKIVVGKVADKNLAISENRILARDNGTAASLFIQPNTTGNTLINFEGGNVAIGGLLPEAKLHLFQGFSGFTGTPNSSFDAIIEDNDFAYLGFEAGEGAGIFFADDNSATYAGIIYENAVDIDRLNFIAGGVGNRMTIRESGAIGINQSQPSATLHIKQQTGGEEGLTIENDGDTDTWAFEIGTNDLVLYFNGANIGKFNDADGVYIPNSDGSLKTGIQSIEGGVMGKIL